MMIACHFAVHVISPEVEWSGDVVLESCTIAIFGLHGKVPSQTQKSSLIAMIEICTTPYRQDYTLYTGNSVHWDYTLYTDT